MLNTILFLESLGGGEVMVIMLFALLFFGSKNIPSLARGLGKGIREFKDAMNGVQSELRQGMNEVERQVEKSIEPDPVPTETKQLEEEKQPEPATAPVIQPPSASLTRE
jgi:sec-independent protein translocase protein TatA